MCLRQLLVGFVAALLPLAAIAAPPPAPQPPPPAVIFENVRIFDGTSDRLSAPSNVLVVGNVTHSISTAAIAAPAGTTVTRIQGGGRTLMPGLIDNHVHITMSAWSQHDALQPDMTADRKC